MFFFCCRCFFAVVAGARFFFCCRCGGAFFFFAVVAGGAFFFLLSLRGGAFFFCCRCGGGGCVLLFAVVVVPGALFLGLSLLTYVAGLKLARGGTAHCSPFGGFGGGGAPPRGTVECVQCGSRARAPDHVQSSIQHCD